MIRNSTRNATAEQVTLTRIKTAESLSPFCFITESDSFVSQPTDGDNAYILVPAQTLPQAVDMHIHRAQLRFALQPPDLVHELLPGIDVPRIGEQLVEQEEFLLGKDLLLARSG